MWDNVSTLYIYNWKMENLDGWEGLKVVFNIFSCFFHYKPASFLSEKNGTCANLYSHNVVICVITCVTICTYNISIFTCCDDSIPRWTLRRFNNKVNIKSFRKKIEREEVFSHRKKGSVYIYLQRLYFFVTIVILMWLVIIWLKHVYIPN